MQSVSAHGQLLVVGLHALLGLAVLGSATLITVLHQQIDPTLAGLFGMILGLAGAGSAAVSAVGTAINGKAAIPPAMISELTSAMREAVDHLAAARHQVDSMTSYGGRRAGDPPAEPYPPLQPPPAAQP